MEVFGKVFLAVFLAELGDKTQIATLLFSAEATVPRWIVFAASSGALVLASAIGVFAGEWITKFGWEKYLPLLSGFLFLFLGFWTLWKHYFSA